MGLTQTDLASRFGKTESAARAWELGRTKPDADTLIELSKYFDCSVDYLLGLSDVKNETERSQQIKTASNLHEGFNNMNTDAQKVMSMVLDILLGVADKGEIPQERKEEFYATITSVNKGLNETMAAYSDAIKFPHPVSSSIDYQGDATPEDLEMMKNHDYIIALAKVYSKFDMCNQRSVKAISDFSDNLKKEFRDSLNLNEDFLQQMFTVSQFINDNI